MIKNNLFQFIIILIPILSQCQVGINTTTPTEALDVNDKLRVRSISASPSNNAIKDSVLVFEDDGILKYTSAKKIVEQAGSGVASVEVTSSISGNGTTSNPLTIAQQGATTDQVLKWDGSQWVPSTLYPKLLVVANRTSTYTVNSTYSTLVYNSTSLNIGSAYNTTSGVFTAPDNGLYQIIFNNQYSYSAYTNQTIFNRITVNGVVDTESANGSWPAGGGVTTYISLNGSTFLNLTAGQTVIIEHKRNNAVTPVTSNGQHVLKIVRLN